MLYKISNTQNKNHDWKVISITGVDGTNHNEVSVNRTSKDGKTFPNFDSIADGAEVEGNFWQSSVGKNYLFAPKEFKGGNKSNSIAKFQETKKKDIENFQEKKADGIAYNNALNTARETCCAMVNAGLLKPVSIEELNALIEENRDHWLREWDSFSNPVA